jgi:hypothetical protein
MAFWFVVLVFAVYRLSHLIAKDDGPWRFIHGIRELVLNKYGYDSWQADGIHCTLCLSIWFSIPAAFCMKPENIVIGFVYWMAIACGALIIERLTYPLNA